MPILKFEDHIGELMLKSLDDLIIKYKGDKIEFYLIEIHPSSLNQELKKMKYGKALMAGNVYTHFKKLLKQFNIDLKELTMNEYPAKHLEIDGAFLDDFTLGNLQELIENLKADNLWFYYEDRNQLGIWDDYLDSFWSFFDTLEIPLDLKANYLKHIRAKHGWAEQ